MSTEDSRWESDRHSQGGEGGGVDAITTLGVWKCRSPAEEHGSERGAFYQKGERNRSSDDLGNEFPGDIGQTHVPAVVIVGKPLMVYP